MPFFDVSLICLNGHMINDKARHEPEYNSPFCETCQAATISKCPACKQDIRGREYEEKSGYMGQTDILEGYPCTVPPNCRLCGGEFPWTEAKRKAALEMFAEQIAEEAERQQFERNLADAMNDTPRAGVAGKLLAKQLKGAGSFLQTFVVEIVSETAKKILMEGR
ncbi:MAG: DUF2321 domain-containing protein [Gemmataceae bacterium]|nr:DUF2321 domain-containing protein [Gemmataceae bacterium]